MRCNGSVVNVINVCICLLHAFIVLTMPLSVPQASLELCWACGEVIKDHVIRALERVYHLSCFTCATCKQQIGEQSFAQGEVGEVYCLQDYYRYEHLKHPLHNTPKKLQLEMTC